MSYGVFYADVAGVIHKCNKLKSSSFVCCSNSQDGIEEVLKAIPGHSGVLHSPAV